MGDLGSATVVASLPPRKRLLADLKKLHNEWIPNSQNLSNTNPNYHPKYENGNQNGNANQNGIENVNGTGTVCGSPSSSSSSAAVSSSVGNFSQGNPTLKISVEILETAKAAAENAGRIARNARKNALEKAAEAARASDAAKKALEVAAQAAREEADNLTVPKVPKHGKKHVNIKVLYDDDDSGAVSSKGSTNVERNRQANSPGASGQGFGKGKGLSGSDSNGNDNDNKIDDEELARRLHREINSSPRFSTRAVRFPAPRALPAERSGNDSNCPRKIIVSSSVEEEGSCCNVDNMKQQGYFDLKDAGSVNNHKVGFQRKRVLPSDSSLFVSEYKSDSSKFSTNQNSAGPGSQGSCLVHGSLPRSPVKRSKVRHGLERRTKSISMDFSQVSDLSYETASSWDRDRVQKFSENFQVPAATRARGSLPPTAPPVGSRHTRQWA